MEKQRINIVWFKRDLRLRDHAPLSAAIRDGLPVLLLYCFEPSLMAAPVHAPRHWRFVYESLKDLQQQLRPFRAPLYILHREIVPVLEQLTGKYEINGLFSHQETGIKISYDRDLAVGDFCKKRNIPWYEFSQDGVIRGLRYRHGFWEHWKNSMSSETDHPELARLNAVELPRAFHKQLKGDSLPKAFTQRHTAFQPGGESYAWRYLENFLLERAANYGFHLSKPLLSRRSCSRLSPYLAYGNISPREVYQWSSRYLDHPVPGRQLSHFRDRLWWRSHYMQKMESEWQIECRAINHELDDIDRTYDPLLFEAWAEGRTGIPMVDASMRCLRENGWLNFRMRAMLATFVTFTLWQDWKPAAIHLARLFLDFEPGIHYGQFQMQAGLSGYHPLRIFNPTIQARQHDPEGAFIHRYVPELRSVPAPAVHTPWTLTRMEQQLYRCTLPVDYPAAVVDYDAATRRARARYWNFRQRPAVKAYLPKLWRRHCLPRNIVEYRKTVLGVEEKE